MNSQFNKKLITEDGTEYYGYSFGAPVEHVCEMVFNTSMVGYQEILSDPSYTYQAVVMTYPLIGNYGMADDDYETVHPTVGGFIVREYNGHPSNFRGKETLSSVMERFGIPGIYGLDTRKLTRYIRDHGCRKILLTSADTSLGEGMKILSNTEIPHNAVSKVSCTESYISEAVGESKYNVTVVDCGVKLGMVRMLNRRGCRVTVVPWNSTAGEIDSTVPDGILFSNGPGDPTDVPQTVALAKSVIGRYPVFGICLGHQIISLAYGAATYKLPFGHRGGNHPVKELKSGKIEITSQNHSYAVSNDSILPTRLTATHINLLDNTVEGVECRADRVFAVQYHPESAPGPQDRSYLFDRFIALMEESNA